MARAFLDAIDTASTRARVLIRGILSDPLFTTKDMGQGAGLGLSAVHGTMKSMRGADSTPNEATTFHLYSPMREPPSEPTKMQSETKMAQGRGERILWVDDETLLVSLGGHLLEALGYVPSTFDRPLAALEAFRANPASFDAVITDLAMPGLTGLKLAEQLLAIRPEIPVLVMSGNIDAEARDLAARLGVREVLFKPLGIGELSRALARVFGDAPPPRSALT